MVGGSGSAPVYGGGGGGSRYDSNGAGVGTSSAGRGQGSGGGSWAKVKPQVFQLTSNLLRFCPGKWLLQLCHAATLVLTNLLPGEPLLGITECRCRPKSPLTMLCTGALVTPAVEEARR